MKKTFAMCLALGTCMLGAQTVAENGKSNAEIVLPSNPGRTEKFASGELAFWVEKITGAKLPVSEGRAKTQALPVKLLLGRALAAERYAEDIGKLDGSDGFAVRRAGGDIHIFGATRKGTLNGVYAFLENNTDIIWARGENPEAVFTPARTLVLKQTDFLEKPVSNFRGWQICSRPYHRGTELWNARMRCNRNPTQYNRKDSYERSLDTGMTMCPLFGHNLKRFLRRADMRKHPEYFALTGGKRCPAGVAQLCFSNMDGADLFAERVLEEIAALKRKNVRTDMISINIEDNHNLCECGSCLREIALPDGKKCSPDDVNFRSTQFFIYLNRIAGRIAKEHPGLRIQTLAYFFTVEPPSVDIADTIDIAFCPAVKDDKRSILHPKNAVWKKRIDEFAKRSKNVCWREYYGCASGFPRPLSEKVAEDLRYLDGIGVRKYYAEYIPDLRIPADPGKKKAEFRSDINWDVSAMEFWIISKLYWNPYQDAAKLRDEYLERAYHAAAPAMKKYCALIRKAWYDDELPSTLSDSVYRNAVHYIVGKGNTDACRAALAEAEKAAAAEPAVASLVARQRERFEDWIAKKDLFMAPVLNVPLVAEAEKAASDPASALWESASEIDGFRVMDRPGVLSKYATTVRAMHDGKRLYIRFSCQDPAPEKLASRRNLTNLEMFNGGDHVELFLDLPEKKELYKHFAVNFRGEKYDARGYDSGWNGKWNVFTQVGKDGWHAVLGIPFAAVAFDPAKDSSIHAMFYRMFQHDGSDGPKESSSWMGMVVHQPAGFGKLVIGK